MAVGYPINKQVVDAKSADLARQIRDTFQRIESFKAWLDTQQEADLTALGYTSGEVAILKSACTDLKALSDVAHARATVTAVNDFLFWSAKLLGVE